MNQTCTTQPTESNEFVDSVPVPDDTYLCGCIDNYDLSDWIVPEEEDSLDVIEQELAIEAQTDVTLQEPESKLEISEEAQQTKITFTPYEDQIVAL